MNEKWSGLNTFQKNGIYALIIFVVFTVIYMFFRPVGIKFSSSDEGLNLQGVRDTSVTIPFTDITSVEYVEEPDYGAPKDGGTEGKYMYGTWESSALGTYEAYVATDIKGCVCIRTEAMNYCFNIERSDTTEEFARSFGQYIEENF